MKFGVIYTIEWDDDHWQGECPFESGDAPEDFDISLFEMTEDGEGDTDIYENGRSRKYVSRHLLTRDQFDAFLRYTRLVAVETETMGSIVGGKWGMGWWVPAIPFQDSGSGDEFFEDAYVTPVPDVPPRQFAVDKTDQFGLASAVLDQNEYMTQRWERVRKAVISVYGD